MTEALDIPNHSLDISGALMPKVCVCACMRACVFVRVHVCSFASLLRLVE